MDTQTSSTLTPVRRHPRRRLLAVGVALLLIVGVGVLLSRRPGGQAHHRGAGKQDASAPQAVTAAQAALGDIPITLTELGTVTPLITATVKSQISGYLTQIAFHEGQEVRKGDFLAQVDPRPYQAVLEQYEGNLLRDQALLRNAQLDLSRYRNLARLNSIAGQNVDTQAALVAQYQGAIKADQGLIDAQKLNIDYCHIIAPADGRLGLRQVDVGNYVSPGDTAGIVVLTQLKPISVVFTIPQTELAPVLRRVGQATLPVTALATDATTVLASGRLETIDNQIDTTTGTVKLRALFDNADETLFPNQFVNVSLLVQTISRALLIPNEALQRGTPGTYVYLVGGDRSVSLRPVAIGASALGKTIVTAGLKVGDSVVTDGTSRLHAGSKVRIVAGPQ